MAKASFFLPSTYNCAGFPKIKNPVNAAENTNRSNIVMGTRIIFALPNFIREP